MRTALLSIFSALALAATAQAQQLLSADEAREIFVGKPWHSDHGAFIFRDDGTYSYHEFGQQQERGTWPYRILRNGTFTTRTTDYTFYRTRDGYEYHHSRSNRRYPAYPDKSYPR
ncbi:MAG: hypothetical protein CVT80_04970 [Alphaproteobacteria bacterium HGW-Alphaproteobacteria-2]|nr:MAG: hypothetical protein CVT80_04970 [Alphaproteobacteria bacterium HGW-Alphaproteobacteria-2]